MTGSTALHRQQGYYLPCCGGRSVWICADCGAVCTDQQEKSRGCLLYQALCQADTHEYSVLSETARDCEVHIMFTLVASSGLAPGCWLGWDCAPLVAMSPDAGSDPNGGSSAAELLPSEEFEGLHK